jgi:hypothetical protein
VDKKPPPLLGFNNNVRHHGRIFHIQTEDSGIKHARIVTHLFADGGRIVNSTRTDYAEHLGRSDLNETLRRIMREQHKAMFIRLRAGELDALVEAACGPHRDVGTRQPEPSASPSAPDRPVASPPAAPVSLEASTKPAPSPAGEPAAQPARRRRLSNPNLQPAPPSVAPPAGEIDIDEAMLEGSEHRPAPRHSARASAIEPSEKANEEQKPSDEQKPGEEEVRYAPPRPPNIFEAPLTEHSIFGERLIREKSLDEVILSYLADDLEGGTNE